MHANALDASRSAIYCAPNFRRRGGAAVPIDQSSFSSVLSDAEELDLVARRETDEVMRLFEPGFPFGDVLTRADSVHVHVRVARCGTTPARSPARRLVGSRERQYQAARPPSPARTCP
jgi:hypothetical protein